LSGLFDSEKPKIVAWFHRNGWHGFTEIGKQHRISPRRLLRTNIFSFLFFIFLAWKKF